MDLVVYIFRNSSRKGIEPIKSELSKVKEHLRYVFVQNPMETRRLVYHAASIIGIARECTIFTPCETMRVFMGLAFLLAFNRFFPFHQGVTNDPVDDTRSSAFKLDKLPWECKSDPSDRIAHWVECGGPASLGPVPNICDPQSFDVLKAFALKTIQDLRVWGLAGKFYRTMKSFN